MSSPMFYLRLASRPRLGTAYHSQYGGALVNCWVRAPTPAEAERVARGMIEAQGWLAEDLEESRRVTQSDYPPGASGAESYAQAEDEGRCAVFHVWPRDESGDAEGEAG
jgi:hypothetical protein